ncbi:AMP-binding protein [Campylobacter mucosalis]|uniref:AMP-binding protein n=1 Tax=Campylobacter mucosalis TaxID=202 RepID=UPI0014701926|nr:AMP-binding protein [Campylobacter mucosalis]
MIEFLENYKERIGQAISGLKALGVKDVKIYLEDSNDFIVAFFAALSLDLKPLVLSSNFSDDDRFFIDDLGKILSNKPSEFNITKDAKFYLKTSGSSGEAKLIEKYLYQMKAEALALKDSFEFGSEFLASVSHQHMFGLTFKIFLPLILGAKIEPKFLNYPEFIYEKELNNRTLISSPTILKALLQNSKKGLLSGLKNIICAGARLDDDLRDEINSLTTCINIYGSTETGVVAFDKNSGFRAISGVKLSTQDDVLVVSSPWCESFKTSDLALVNGDELTLLGRADRIVKINEKRISLDSVERLILSNELIDDCVCVVSDAKERISAIICLSNKGKELFRSDGKIAVSNALKGDLRAEFANNIRHFKVVSKIERNQQGKLPKILADELLNKRYKFEFKQESLSDTNAVFSAFVGYELFYFDGHFLDFPLVPGFVQVECICKLAKELRLDLTSTNKIEAMKFNGFLRPGDSAKFELNIKNNKLYFNIFANDKASASGRICIN